MEGHMAEITHLRLVHSAEPEPRGGPTADDDQAAFLFALIALAGAIGGGLAVAVVWAVSL